MKTITGLTALLLAGCPKTQNAVDAVPVQPVAKHTPAADQVLVAQYLLQTGEPHDEFYGQVYQNTPWGELTFCYKDQGIQQDFSDDVLVVGVGTHEGEE